jgi:hypothetical protein
MKVAIHFELDLDEVKSNLLNRVIIADVDKTVSSVAVNNMVIYGLFVEKAYKSLIDTFYNKLSKN